MERLKAQIAGVLKLLTTAKGRFKRAGRRWQKNHDKAHRWHQEGKENERLGARFSKEGHPKKAEAAYAKAKRCHARAWKAHRRAQHYVAKAKEFAAEVDRYEVSLETKQKKLKDLEARGVHPVSENRVAGGSEKDRLQFCMYYSMEHGSQYYSQEGPVDVKHGLTGPSRGHRHDCSSWYTSMYFSAGLPDPNGGNYETGETMYTGTIGANGKPVSEGQLDTGDAILFGTAPFHHVEMKDGPMSASADTVGHGSDPIDRGTVALLPGPRAYRRFTK